MQSSWVEESVFVLVPTGDLSSQSSDTLMSLRTTPIPQVVSAGSAGVRYPAGSLGCVVVQYVRPVPSELGWGRLSLFSVLLGGWVFCVWGGGGLSRFSVLLGGWVFCVWGGGGCRGLVCCLVAECLGWCAVFSGSALRVSHGRSPQRSKEGRSVRVTGAPA